MSDDSNTERDVDAAMETASRCRQDASIFRQAGMTDYAKWLLENAKAAERWAVQRTRTK